ncbi:non-ribosomal peptide synthetase, partial [Acetivibrio straminisolvens]
MTANKLDKKNIEDILALTAMQEGILFHYRSNPESRQYFEQLCMRIAGNIDIDAFGKAWNYTAQNNEALRTVFRWEKLEKPVQVVLKNYEIPVRLCDISEYNEEEMQSLLERLKEKDREEGIDISTEPFRITLCKLCKDKYEMIISNHHIIYDGWSNSILLKEFFEAYNAFKKGEQPSRPVKNRYREFVKWHQSRDINAQKSYWSKYLEGIESRTLLPWDSKKQGEIKKAGIYTLDIERENTEKIKNFAREQKVALASVLYAAWGILLQRYNNSEDVLFGTTVSGRTAKIKGIENMVGLFINTPPLRVRSQAREKVSDLLNEVEKSLRDRGPYEDTPLTDIKSLSSMDNKESLFDSIMVIENYPIDKQMMNKDSCLAIESFSMSEMTNFDIAVAVSVFDGMELKFIYNSDVFLQATIERMAGQLINIINCMIENPCIEVSKIDILSKDERDEILYRYNNTDTTYPKSKTLSLLFEEQVQRAPDNIALVFEGMEMTYRELNEKANRLAHFLRKKGVAAGNIVGMLMERSPDMIVAIFGILKAGGAYLPIDPEYPLDRIASILRDSGTKFLVLGAGLESKLSLEDSLPELIVMDKDNSAFKNENAENIECINSSEGLAYVMYTSGSTGMPKGNLTTHYNIIRVVKDTNYIDITDRDVLLQLSNYAFDGSTFDIFGALLNGAKLVLVKSQTLLDIFELSRLIERENITVFFITTALFNTLADLNPQCFKNVRKVLFGGERVSVSHVRKVLDYVGPGRLIHVYGPTESTVFASYHFVDSIGDGDATIPIGKPISNTKIYVVDKNNNLQPFGAQGELCIAGDGLAKGYLNRPELTKEKFVPNPFEAYDNDKSSRGNKNKELSLMYRTGDLVRWRSDGSIEFIDRIDTQVKLRGFRVELGEIESKLLEYEGIREGIVVVREDKSGNKYLCAYFTSNEEVSLPSLREYLMAKLPIYMVPSCFVRLYEMPLNSNGKIDKKRLPEPETDKAAEREYVPLEGETEEKLARLWEEVLGVDRVGATDNFFELGGHSLKATVLSARIHREFNKSIPLSKILNVRTLRELADCIDGLEESVYSKINPIEENIGYPKGIYPASSSQKRMFVQHQFEGIGVSYNMPLAFLVEGTVNPYRIRSAFKELVMRHEPMRTSFGIYNGEIVQKIHSEVDFDVDFIECNDKSPDGVLRELVKPFNLEEAPLFRVTLIRLGNDKHILFMDMHHIISDGVSVAILVKEFGELYNGRKLSDLRIQYKDFSYWISKRLQDGALKKQEDFWFKTLEGDIPVLDMPLDFSRSDVRTFVGDTVEFNLGVETSALLNALAQKQGITLNSLLFSVYTALLHRYTGQEDIIIGSLSAGRNHPDLENMVGMFNNFLPIRTQINAAGTFEELMNSVNGELVKAYENQDYPYDMMVEKLSFRPELSRNPFFDTMLIFHNEIDRDISLKLEGLSFDLYKLNSHTSKLDLKLDVYLDKTGSIECIIEYNTALFKKETIERLAKHFANITREVLQKPNKKISEIEMLTREEKEQILFDFNDTNKEYPKEKTLSQVFEEQAERTPDNVAVIFGKEKLTYRELNQRANSLARVLRKKGVGKECIVAIMLERSKEMMVGILAVLKAGGAYLPISPSYPEERIRYMLEDSNATLLLTKEEGYGKKFESPLGLTILDLDDWLLYGEDGSNLEPVNDARSLAYVIYT